jgi:site-specific DNA-adenine methylase
MKPMFPFYGSKWRDAKRYGAPKHDLVIEPFAGSAGYSTYWEPRRVLLADIDPIIVGVWRYLITASADEILRLPDLAPGQSTDDLAVSQEARWLIGFWLNRGSAQPKKTQTEYSRRTERAQLIWSARARERIASQLELIRHWTVVQIEYADFGPIDATWYVDPPYVDKGRFYRCNTVDHDALGAWCRRIPRGQVIVCEQEGARWLPFSPLAIIKSSKGTSSEVVYVT